MDVIAKRKRIQCEILFAVLILLLSSLFVNPAFSETSDGMPIVVSMGDSYSSGEGNEPFYGQDSIDKYTDKDWLAHRSKLAWSGKLRVGNTQLSDLKSGKGWYFTAASGAEVQHLLTNEQEKEAKWFVASTPISWGKKTNLPVQKNIFSDVKKDNPNRTVDYVTLTIGGNDLGFTKILEEAAKNVPYLRHGNLRMKLVAAIAKFYSSTKGDIKKAYTELLKAAGDKATLIVAGYPHLIYLNSHDPLFDSDDAKLIGDAVDLFDEELAEIVSELNSERIVFVDVRGEFKDHEAYSSDNYINQLMVGAQAQDINQTSPVSAYSFHPNASGQEAYARAVQRKIALLEAKKTADRSDSTADEVSQAEDVSDINAEVAMSLVFDVSGSMSDMSGMGGMTKLQSAQRQTQDFVDATKRQADEGELPISMSVSAFSGAAETLSELTNDLDSVISGIDRLEPNGTTNMYAGMSEGVEQLRSAAGQKIMVFLSDGLNNTGATTDEILELAREAADEGIHIYTIGFGPQGDLDEDLLRSIADITGGTYAHEDASSLSAATVGLFGTLMETRLTATSDEVKLSTVGSVRQGEVAEAGSFGMEEEGDLDMYLYWPGSALDFVITDPNGTVVDDGYAGYAIDSSAIPTTVNIANAMIGTWKVDVYGREVSMEQEPFYAAVSYRKAQRPVAASGGGGSAPNGGEGLLFLLLAVTVLSVGGVYAFTIRRGNS